MSIEKRSRTSVTVIDVSRDAANSIAKWKSVEAAADLDDPASALTRALNAIAGARCPARSTNSVAASGVSSLVDVQCRYRPRVVRRPPRAPHGSWRGRAPSSTAPMIVSIR